MDVFFCILNCIVIFKKKFNAYNCVSILSSQKIRFLMVLGLINNLVVNINVLRYINILISDYRMLMLIIIKFLLGQKFGINCMKIIKYKHLLLNYTMSICKLVGDE